MAFLKLLDLVMDKNVFRSFSGDSAVLAVVFLKIVEGMVRASVRSSSRRWRQRCCHCSC